MTKRALTIINNRRDVLNNYLVEYMEKHDKKHLTDVDISYIMTQGNAYVGSNYGYKDMETFFEWYKEVVPRLNDYTISNIPTRSQFCQLIGISTDDYVSMLKSESQDMVRIMIKIEDYIMDMIYRAGATNVINKDMAKHQLEAVHGQVVVKKSEVTTIEEKIDIKGARDRLSSILTEVVDAEFEEVKED